MPPAETNLPSRRLRGGVRVRRAERSVVSAPTRSDPVARSLSQLIGGPEGSFAARGVGPWSAISVLILLAGITMIGAVLSKQHCRENGWSNPDQFWHACYSDTAVLYSSAQLGSAERPSLRDAVGPAGMGQEPVTGTAMWVVSGVVRAIWGEGAVATSSEVLRFFDVSAVVLTVVFIGTVVITALTAGRRRAWDAAQVALAPIVLSVGLVSYELLAALLVALALWAWSRSRFVVSGLFLALAIGSRPVTALIIAVFLVLGFRARRTKQALLVAATAGVGWLLLRWVLFAQPLTSLRDTWNTWRGSGPGYGSIWLVPQLIGQSLTSAGVTSSPFTALSARTTSLLTIVALTLVVMLTSYVALSMPTRPRVAHLALFVVALGLLSVKAFPPQASLVLLPLISLSALKWRDHLIWATAEIAYYVAVWMYIAATDDPNRGLPPQFYMLFLLLRVAAVGWLVVQVWRMMRHPRRDPVRSPTDPLEGVSGVDDPAGGVLVMAPSAAP